MNEFSLEVGNSKPLPGDASFRTLTNGQEYTVICRNHLGQRCDVEVSVDGLAVGKWRIDPYSEICIERPAGVERKFTFVQEGSSLAATAGLVPHSNNGLITAKFYPEKPQIVPKNAVRAMGLIPQGAVAEGGGSRYSSGGTTLGAKSDQRFVTTGALKEIDEKRITTRHLRLIIREEPEEPISLRRYSEAELRNQPVPPRLPFQ